MLDKVKFSTIINYMRILLDMLINLNEDSPHDMDHLVMKMKSKSKSDFQFVICLGLLLGCRVGGRYIRKEEAC